MAAKTPVQIKDIDERLEQMSSIVELPKVAVPFTTILRRAQVTDFSKDLLPRLGIDRIPTQQLQEIQGEGVQTNERVFKILNDVHDQIRFVGSWSNSFGNDGHSVSSGVIGDYVEVVFYGTGINVLMTNLTTDRGFTVFIDGVSVNTIVTTNSSVLGSRNYPPNVIFVAAQNLALGLHTARLVKTTAANSNICGFDIITGGTTLQLPPGASYSGGKRLYKSALSTDAFASNFESGTLGSKGGRVLVYQKSDGTIGKALQPTDTSQLNLTAANHANEEIIRSYHFREFGAGRADDFSTLQGTSPTSRAFTLDDGVTTLAGSSLGVEFDSITLFVNSTGYVTFTFVGTGLDIQTTAETTGSCTFDVSVDGTSIGTLTNSNPERALTFPIVSGLPYGTHVVRILRLTASGSSPHIAKFITYGPKKPTLPAGAVELANYYLMATFAANLTAGTNTIATGVLRKQSIREFSFPTGTWTAGFNAGQLGGWDVSSITNPKSMSYTFFGTGFDIRWQTGNVRTTAATVTLNGVSLNNAYPSAASINCSVAGTGIAYGGQTGSFLLSAVGASPVFDTQDAGTGDGNSFRVSNLPLAVYTVVVSDATTNILHLEAIDIITPIHAPGSNLPGNLQGSTLSVGSMGIGDTRALSEAGVKTLSNWAQAIGVTSTPTLGVLGLATPIPDLTCIIKTNGGAVEINWAAEIETISASATSRLDTQFYVNGVAVGQPSINQWTTANQNIGTSVSNTLVLSLAAGVHVIQVYWTVSGTGAVARSSGTSRILTVKEIQSVL